MHKSNRCQFEARTQTGLNKLITSEFFEPNKANTGKLRKLLVDVFECDSDTNATTVWGFSVLTVPRRLRVLSRQHTGLESGVLISGEFGPCY